MYFLRANTKKSLGEETFQRDILTGTTNRKEILSFFNWFVQDLLMPLQRSICFGTLKGLSQTYSFLSLTARPPLIRYLRSCSEKLRKSSFPASDPSQGKNEISYLYLYSIQWLSEKDKFSAVLCVLLSMFGASQS